MNSDRLSKIEFAFLVSATDAGGISAHTRKWALELNRRGRNVRVICYRDIRSPYSTKVTPERFAPVQTTLVEFDSLDKETVLGKTVAEAICPDSEMVLFSPWVPKASAIVNELRTQGHTVWHIEQAVGNDDDGFRTVEQNWSTCDGVVAFGSRIEKRIQKLRSYKQRTVKTFQSLPGSTLTKEFHNRDDSRFSPIRICYLGRLERVQKRVFDLVELAGHLQSMNTDFHLTVIGGGNCQSELQQRFNDTVDDAKVTLRGQLPHDEAMEVLAEQLIFVLPSASEGFPGALCEAMCRGVVPVSTKVGGAEDVIEQGVNGFLVEIGDTKSMARRIVQASRDFLTWSSLSKHARHTAELELSEAAAVDKLERGVASIIDDDPAGVHAGRYQYSTILEHPMVPNVATRTIRSLWRACRPRPTDIRRVKKA